jgi:hypothetical protein
LVSAGEEFHPVQRSGGFAGLGTLELDDQEIVLEQPQALDGESPPPAASVSGPKPAIAFGSPVYDFTRTSPLTPAARRSGPKEQGGPRARP